MKIILNTVLQNKSTHMKKQSQMLDDPEIWKKRLRFLVLVLVCLYQFSGYYIFDQPALLKQEIMENFIPIYGIEATNFYFSFLYSFYSIPNIILPLVGGLLCDKMGYRKMSVIFLFCVMFGQTILYLGSASNNLKVMILGRFLYGLGGESIGITANVVQVKWFTGKELSFASAINLSLIRSASVLNTFLTPKIAEVDDSLYNIIQKSGMSTAFGFGAFLCSLSLLALLMLNYMDYAVDEKTKKNSEIINESAHAFDLGDLIAQTKSDMKSFPKIFWLMTGLMTTFYASSLMFISFSSSIITELWLPPTNKAEQNEQIIGDLMALPYMSCMFLSPLVGLMIDKRGQRIKIMLVATFLVLFAIFLILFFYPIYTMILLGVAYSLFASCVWTAITFVVTKERLGTAYGVMNSIQNFAFFLMPLFIAIISSIGTQLTVVLFFLILACFSCILSVWLFKEDYRRNISLDESNQIILMSAINKKLESIKEEDEETDSIIKPVD